MILKCKRDECKLSKTAVKDVFAVFECLNKFNSTIFLRSWVDVICLCCFFFHVSAREYTAGFLPLCVPGAV